MLEYLIGLTDIEFLSRRWFNVGIFMTFCNLIIIAIYNWLVYIGRLKVDRFIFNDIMFIVVMAVMGPVNILLFLFTLYAVFDDVRKYYYHKGGNQ